MNNLPDEITIDIFALFRALWQRALAILLAGLLLAAAGFGYSVTMVSPTYRATASIYVNNSIFTLGTSAFSVTSSELSTSSDLVNTYIYILKSRTTLEDVIARAGVNYSPDMLKGMISARQVEGTAALEITVTSHNPTDVELLANTIAKVLPERIAEIVDGTSVRIVDYAITPTHRSAPSHVGNALKGFILGAFAAACYVAVKFIIDSANDTAIHSADDLRRFYPDIPVLALIPDMRLSEKKNGYYYSSYYSSSSKKKGKN